MMRSIILLLALLFTSAHAQTVRLSQTDFDGERTAYATIEIDSTTHHVESVTGTDFAGSEYSQVLTPYALRDDTTFRCNGPWMRLVSLYGRWYFIWFGLDGTVSGLLRKGGPGYVDDLHTYRTAPAGDEAGWAEVPIRPEHR